MAAIERASVIGRLSDFARNLRYVASFVVGAVATDPAYLMLQIARRTPARVSGRLVPWVERLLGDGTTTPAGRLRSAWQVGDLEVVEQTDPFDRASERVRNSVLGQVTMLKPLPEVLLKPTVEQLTRRWAAGRSFAVHHHLSNSLPHTRSGYTLRTQGILAEQLRSGIQVTATTRPGYPLSIGSLGARSVDVVNGVGFRRLTPRRLEADQLRRFERGVDLLCDVLREVTPHLIHTTSPWTTGETARVAAARLGLPWIYEVRGLPEETWVASHTNPAARVQAAASERYVLIRSKETELAREADHVVTLSATMRDELIARGIPMERITVVPNAVEHVHADHRTPAEVRASLGLETAPFVVGTVSSLIGYEGLETILHTVARLRASGRDVTALIVGDGVARPGLVRLAHDLNLAEHAILPGRVPPEVARSYLAAIDVVLIPRRGDRVTRLVTPLKPVEAMAAGRPVIASDLPALAESLRPLDDDNPAGILVAPDDTDAWANAIESLASDEGRRAAMVAAGHRVAAQRTWAHMATRYETVYSQVLADSAAH